VLSLTRALAVDHAQHNIRVNAICPGTTNTGWISSILKNHPEPEVALEAMERRQLVGRLGDPDEIAHGIKFLIDNSFATGSCLVVDGGMTTT
jgi:NAD(P)-dependent dehydrogenase (short-subunit alcohol dehydrogenase family)